MGWSWEDVGVGSIEVADKMEILEMNVKKRNIHVWC